MKKIFGYLSGLFKGRLGRLDYFTFLYMLLPLFAIVLIVLSALVERFLAFLGLDVNFVVILPIIIYLFLYVSLVIRRGHDMGWSTLFSFFMSIIGIIIIIPYLFLLFKKSDEGENKYGVLSSGGYWKRLLNI